MKAAVRAGRRAERGGERRRREHRGWSPATAARLGRQGRLARAAVRQPCVGRHGPGAVAGSPPHDTSVRGCAAPPHDKGLGSSVIAIDLASLTDARLVSRILEGDLGAFDELVRRYERPVRQLARRILGDPALAEDVAQETFLKVFRHLGRYDPGRRLASWLFRIAHRTALDALRRRRSEAMPVADVPATPPLDPSSTGPDRLALAQALEAALGRLRVEYRVALVLRYQEGLSYGEIAEVLGVPEGTAKTFVHRARRAVAGALEAAGWRL